MLKQVKDLDVSVRAINTLGDYAVKHIVQMEATDLGSIKNVSRPTLKSIQDAIGINIWFDNDGNNLSCIYKDKGCVGRYYNNSNTVKLCEKAGCPRLKAFKAILS